MLAWQVTVSNNLAMTWDEIQTLQLEVAREVGAAYGLRAEIAEPEDPNTSAFVVTAVIIVSAMASLQAALRPLFERFAAGRAGTSRRSTSHPNRSFGLAPNNRSAAVVP